MLPIHDEQSHRLDRCVRSYLNIC